MDQAGMNLVNFGIVNRLTSYRTGNTTLDLLLSILLPLLLTWLGSEGMRRWHTFYDWLKEMLRIREKKYFIREIQWRRSDTWFCASDDQSSILQTALQQYLHDKFPEMLAGLHSARVTVKYEAPARTSRPDYDSDCSYESDEDHEGTQWLNYKVSSELEDGDYVDVPGLPLQIMRTEETKSNDSGKITTRSVSYFLRSPKSAEVIDNFLQQAKEHMHAVEQAKTANNKTRYLYLPVKYNSSNDDNDEGTPHHLFRRYPLDDRHTFASWFHPAKHDLLKLVDAFLNRTGKFAIPGYPWKLGLLLHGPPGTGKTSFIRAMAQYTGRSLITLNLANIQTNQELMDLVFGVKRKVAGMHSTVDIPYSKCIFVMEDVDAASKVVKRRTDNPVDDSAAALTFRASTPVTAMQSTNSSDASDSGTDSDEDEPCSTPDKAVVAAQQQAMLKSLIRAKRKAAAQKAAKAGGDAGTSAGALGAMGPWANLFNTDELNLAGLLNVLDGVVDMPGRIVIMTSNHPEELDPALIRPGRINKLVELSYVEPMQGFSMLQHWFADQMPLKDQQKQRITYMLSTGRVTPAQLEGLCAEHDTVDTLLNELETALVQRQQLPGFFQHIAGPPAGPSAGASAGASADASAGDSGSSTPEGPPKGPGVSPFAEPVWPEGDGGFGSTFVAHDSYLVKQLDSASSFLSTGHLFKVEEGSREGLESPSVEGPLEGPCDEKKGKGSLRHKISKVLHHKR